MKYLLNVEKEFMDKLTNEYHRVGKVIERDKKRTKELLADKRKLVSLNSKLEEPKDNTKGKKTKNIETATVEPVNVETPENPKTDKE